MTGGSRAGLSPAPSRLSGSGIPLDDSVIAIDGDCPPVEMFAVSLREPGSPMVGAYLDLFQELIGRTGKNIPAIARRAAHPA